MRLIAAALAVLAGFQDSEVDALLNGLSDDSIEVRERAVRALIELGPKVEAKVRAKMESSQGEVRRVCETLLGRFARQQRVESVLPPVKRVTIDAKGRKLKDVLSELQRQSEMPMDYAGLEDAPVTLQVKEAPPLEAINAVCRAAGLAYSVSAPPRDAGSRTPPNLKDFAFRFKPGEYAEAPRQFTGHFAVECTRITLDRRTRFDFDSRMIRMSFRLMWPPGVRPDQAFLDIASVSDGKGGKLYERPSYAVFGQSGFGHMPGQISFSTEAGAEFRSPGEVEMKVSVQGAALLLFAGEDRYITFEAPEKSLGQKKELAEMSVELRNLKEAGGMTVVTIAFTGRPKNAVPGMRVAMGGLGSRYYKVRLEDGTSVDCRNTSSRHEGAVHVMDLNFPGLTSKIAAVDVLAETAYHEERFDFEFKDIPLPR